MNYCRALTVILFMVLLSRAAEDASSQKAELPKNIVMVCTHGPVPGKSVYYAKALLNYPGEPLLAAFLRKKLKIQQ